MNAQRYCNCEECLDRAEAFKVRSANNVTPRPRAADQGSAPELQIPGSGHSGLCAPEQSAVPPFTPPEETKPSGELKAGVVWVHGMNLQDAEKQVILRSLAIHRGNRTRTAKALNISLRALRYKIAQYLNEGAPLAP